MDFVRTRRRTRPLPLTSLIDVLCVLVIFFMLTTSFVKVQSLELSLPSRAASKETVVTSDIILVNMFANGALQINGKIVSGADFRANMAELVHNAPKRKVWLRCDGNASLQKLITVMDAIYQSGGRNLVVDRLPDGIDVQTPAQQDAFGRQLLDNPLMLEGVVQDNSPEDVQSGTDALKGVQP